MYFSGTKKQKRLRMILDIINTVIGIAIIVLTIVAFNADDGYIVYFPYMFLLGGTMNLLAAIKNECDNCNIFCGRNCHISFNTLVSGS